MFKKIFISIIIALLAVTAIFGSVPTFAQDSNVIGFTECGFKLPKSGETPATGSESAISKCIKQIMTFLFVIGIFMMAFRIAYIGINKFNPLEQGGEAQQVGMIRDIAIGLILLGSPALVLGALNEDLLKINFLDFSSFTGGLASLKPVVPVSDVNQIARTDVDPFELIPIKDKAKATATTNGGKLVKIDIGEGGSNYQYPPKVKIVRKVPIDPPRVETDADAVASIQGGSVTSIRITNPGTGYDENPEIEFDGGTAETKVVEKTVVGLSPSFLSATFEALRYSNTSSFPGDIIKFLKVKKFCNYRIFTFLDIQDIDCVNVNDESFNVVLRKYSNEVDYIQRNGSKTLNSFDGFFTNKEPIFVQATGGRANVTDGYSYGTFDEAPGKIKCFENFFYVYTPKYNKKLISTKECGKNNLDKDTANLTQFGVTRQICFGGCVGGDDYRNPTTEAINGINFPKDFNFNRQITIFD